MRHCQKLNPQKQSNRLLFLTQSKSLSFQPQLQSQYKYERHFVITDQRHIDIWREHSALVLPHISKKTASEIKKLKNRENEGVLIRSECDENMTACTNQIFEFLNQSIIDVRPASLQPLLVPITKQIRNEHPKNLDIFIDSYSSQIYVRGNENSKKIAVETLNKLLSVDHLKILRYLFVCRNILSKEVIFDLAKKYDIFIADNFANARGSKSIQYFMTSLRRRNMHSFLTELAKIAQNGQPDKIRQILFVLRHVFMHHSIHSSAYIDLKTFVCILRNLPTVNASNYDLSQHQNNEILMDIFHKSLFCVNGNRKKINFVQLALTLCVNDENMQCMQIWKILNESYKNQTISAWNRMYFEPKSSSKVNKEKKEKTVTVSLKIGGDGNSLPLFIGKNGKNLKFIEQSSGISQVHTSWLIGEQHNESKHDSITLKGTQKQIENALRASSIILERIGKWYDKKKLSLIHTALAMNDDDLQTFDLHTFEKALLSIPDIDKEKLLKKQRDEPGKWLIFGKKEATKTDVRLIDLVFDYCANKHGRVYLLNLNANFYCNVSPMIEFRECFPFVASTKYEHETKQSAEEEEQNVSDLLSQLSMTDEQSLHCLHGQIIDEWHDKETGKVRKKEIVQISDKTAMSMTDSTLNTISHYSSCTISPHLNLEANKVEIVGNEYERLRAKSFLTEPLMQHWNAHKCVNWLLGKSGRRIKKIEEWTQCRVEVVNLDESSAQIIIRGLPSFQSKAIALCLETQKLLTTTIPQWSVNGVIGRNGAGLNKLAYISGADIFIDKAVGDESRSAKEVNVEIVGTAHQKSKALSLLQKWGSATLKMRHAQNFKLRVTDIPSEHQQSNEITEAYINEILSPFANVLSIKIIDYRKSATFKKRSLSFFAYVCVDSFDGKMRAIATLNNAHDTNLKIWNGEPCGTMIAPSVPFSIAEDEFKRNCFAAYQDVTAIHIDARTKIDRYTAYIEFNNKTSFERACDYNLRIRGEQITTFAARQWAKELRAYRLDENDYKKEFAFYLEHCLDNLENHHLAQKSLTLEQLPKMYEDICNVPWLKCFDSNILKLHALKQLDERIVLTQEQKEMAEKKYFYLVNDDKGQIDYEIVS